MRSNNKKTGSVLVAMLLLLAGLAGAGVWIFQRWMGGVKGDMASLILENPDSTSIAAYTFDARGEVVEDGRSLFLNADSPLVMASTMKVVVLAAYAEAVASGALDPTEAVPIVEVERFYLPSTDGGAHAEGLRSLSLEVGEHGFARDTAASVSLQDIARIMIHYSGNAETDYLLERLGPERLTAVMRKAGLANHTPIAPILGVVLSAHNHETAALPMDRLAALTAGVERGDLATLSRWASRYTDDHPAWRQAELGFRGSIQAQTDPAMDLWAYETAASRLFPRGTAREYARMMALIASGQFLSPEISKIMAGILETVPSDWPLRTLYFDRYGAKDGVTAGVLSLASYGVPKRGSLSGQSRVVVILTNQLPLEGWTAQVQSQGHYLLGIDLAEGRGVFELLSGRSAGDFE